MLLRFAATLVAACLFCATIAAPGAASPAQPAYDIRNDAGGHVVDYGLRVRQMADQGRQVRFAGRCDSACTLYLALPAEQICVTPRARFGFHLPFGGGPRGDHAARTYLLDSYPDWVRHWIDRNGGLTNRLIVMEYAYASRFVEVCDV